MGKPLARLGVGAATAALAVAGLGLYGSSQIVRPRRPDFQDHPSAWQLQAEEVGFPSRDGVPLKAWLMRSSEADATVIVAHGHGATRDFALPVAAMLHPRFHVLALDFRAHGASGGRVSSVGYLERLDLFAAVDEAERRSLGPVGVLGNSMGASAAILAAAEDGRIAAVAADSGFASLRGVIAHMARRRGYPRVCAPVLAEITCRTIAIQQGYPVHAVDPARVVHRISPRPLLVLHSEADNVCTIDHGQRLYRNAREPKSRWIVPDVEHALLFQMRADEYRQQILDFFGLWLRSV